MKMHYSARFLVAACGLLIAAQVSAFTIPPNDGFVTDAAGILSLDEEQLIEQTLKDYQKETSNEIAVLIVNTMDGDEIGDVAFEVGREWGVGTSENNNGILILVAYEDRKLFLATGYGLEGAVPDIVARGIIDKDITPEFKNGNYAAGIQSGIESLKKHIGGEFTADRYENSSGKNMDWGWLVFIIFMLIQWLFAILARTKSWWLGGIFGVIAGIVLVILFAWWISIPILAVIGLVLDYLVSKNYKKNRGKASWWAGGGGWGGGSSSGGFGGFGGGSFGGGGAGGSW